MGTPTVQLNDQTVTFPTRKALALFIYIVVERHVHPRETLMALFWPESGTAKAQSSLRTTLAYIRKTLPEPFLVIERDTVCFEDNMSLNLDLTHLQAAAETSIQLPLHQSALIPLLKKAVQNIQGDFLSGFWLKDAPAFDDWASVRREIYHQQTVRVFETLSRLQLETGAITDGLETAADWVQLAPLDENAYQRQMQLYLAQGNRLAVLQTYKTCCLMLASEFGISPSPQTDILAQQAQAATEQHKSLDLEAECIALNRMATVSAQSTYDLERALDLLRQALHLAKQLENPLHLAETHWNLSQTYFYMGSLESALKHGEAAVAQARAIQRDDLLGRALNTVAYIKLLSGHPVAAIVDCVDEAIILFKKLFQPALEIDCLTVKANAYLCNGYPAEGLRYATEGLTISERIQNDWGYASAAYNLGFAYLDTGDIEKAIIICQHGLAKARIAGHPPLIFFNMLVLGHVYRAHQQVNLALELHIEGERIANSLKSPFFRMLIITELCADYMELGQWAKAAQYALDLQPLRVRVPYPDFCRWFAIEALLRVGNSHMVMHELALLRESARTNRRHAYFLERTLAAIALWKQDINQAYDSLKSAATLAEIYGFRTEWKSTRRLLEIVNNSQ